MLRRPRAGGLRVSEQLHGGVDGEVVEQTPSTMRPPYIDDGPEEPDTGGGHGRGLPHRARRRRPLAVARVWIFFVSSSRVVPPCWRTFSARSYSSSSSRLPSAMRRVRRRFFST